MWRVLSSMPPGKKAGLSPPSPLPNQYLPPCMGPTGYPPISGGPSRKPEDTRFIDDGLKELLAS